MKIKNKNSAYSALLAKKIRSNRFRAGSTLVEMVITVGLLVSVMVPLVAMLTMGMETSLQAGINSVGSRITNQLISELQQAKWQELDNWNGRTVYFDDQGLLMDGGDAGRNATFVAQIHLSDPGLTLATNNSTPDNVLQRKVTTIVSPMRGNNPEQLLSESLTALQNGDSLPNRVKVSHGLVTKTGKDA